MRITGGGGYDDIVLATYGQGPNPYQEGYIRVVDRSGTSLPAWPVQTPSCIPSAGFGARLSWSRPLLASVYNVYRGTDASFPVDEGHLIADGWPLTFLIDPGSCGDPSANYFHAIVPRNAWGCGPPSHRVGELDWGEAAAVGH